MRIRRGLPVYRSGTELPRQHSQVCGRAYSACLAPSSMVKRSIDDVIVVRNQPGRPHSGKVFAAVHAHLSDVPHYAAGLCAKLISEGYTGYLIRSTNDEKSGGQSIARN